MKKSNAIICELNPIHPGHVHVLNIGKNDNDVNIAVMSGNFTQRGIPAVYDKYVRAEAAIRCGADLVLELAFPWCVSGAEHFANAGVTVAADCGAQSLTFGSESGEIQLLHRLAEIKASAEYAEVMRKAERETRKRGSALLFDDILRQNGIETSVGANDKLGGEYIRFGCTYGIHDFRPVKRIKDAPSATAVRDILYNRGLEACENCLPHEAYQVFASHTPCSENQLYKLFFMHCRLYVRAEEENDLLRYAAKTARSVETASEFIKKLPTKKYTLSRLRREILYSILSVKQKNYRTRPEFTVLLAANAEGRAYLAEQGKSFNMPVITKPADDSALGETAKKQYALHRRADELYAFLMGWSADAFMKRHPVIL